MREFGLSAAFTGRVNDLHGERGREWLASLPVLIDQYAVRWSLSIGPTIGDLSYNWVAPAHRVDGTEVVPKLGVPHREFKSEVEALRIFDGRGSVRLIDADPDRGAMLLERADPGVPLWGVDDEQAAPIVAGVMKALWRPAPADHRFPTLADWAREFDCLRGRFDGATGPLPAPMVEKAQRTFRELGSAAEPVVLHGDLHHGNVLTARRLPYLAIDPKGVVGAPVYEVGAFVRNGVVLASPDPASVLRRRIEILSEHLGFERARIRDAAFAASVLSAWWSIENHGRGWQETMRIARYLGELQVQV